MALINCPECEKQISDKAISCPNCGLPMKEAPAPQKPKSAKRYTQRSDGRWYTQLNTGKYTDDGKPIRIPLYANSEKELIKLVNDTKYEIKNGIYAHDKGIIFGDYAAKWLAVSKASKGLRTVQMYENIIKNHITEIKHKKLKDITKSDIQLVINKRINKPRICEQLRLTFKQIFENAVEDGLILRNPCTGIELPRRVPKEKRALTDDEKQALKNTNLTTMEKAFIYILYGCGVRPGELYALTREDINLKTKEITINKALTFPTNNPTVVYPKTNNGIRIIDTPSYVIDAIRAHLINNNNLVLFCDSEGNYQTKSAYYNIFNQIVRKMREYAITEEKKTRSLKSDTAIQEVKETKFHDLTQYTFRHNYCTELYYSDISLKKAQQLMGHADANMIMKVYSHLDEKKEQTKAKIEKLTL